MVGDIHWLHSEQYCRVCDEIRSHKHGSLTSGTLISIEQVS